MKNVRKLVLSKETLRELTGQDLKRVAGAVREVCDIDTRCKNDNTAGCSGSPTCDCGTGGGTGGGGGQTYTCQCSIDDTCAEQTCDFTMNLC